MEWEGAAVEAECGTGRIWATAVVRARQGPETRFVIPAELWQPVFDQPQSCTSFCKAMGAWVQSCGYCIALYSVFVCRTRLICAAPSVAAASAFNGASWTSIVNNAASFLLLPFAAGALIAWLTSRKNNLRQWQMATVNAEGVCMCALLRDECACRPLAGALEAADSAS